jgi:uncharacterized protein (TIGR03083 family)
VPSGEQFYGNAGVPFGLPFAPDQVVSAWQSQRARLRDWYAVLPATAWSAPTRCPAWPTRQMAQHLVTGAQFLAYTLHQARKGEATRVLENFDPQTTPGVVVAQLDGLTNDEVLSQFAQVDARIADECRALEADGWQATAEAPPGHVPAHVTLAHFLFDSWVHERDLMLPRGEEPVVDPNEAATVAAYVVGLAGVMRPFGAAPPPTTSFTVHLTDIDRWLHADVSPQRAIVTCREPDGIATVAGATGDVMDLATGREVGPSVRCDQDAAVVLERLARVMQ